MLLLLFFAGCQSQPKEKKQDDLLFVIHAKSAQFNAQGTMEGELTLNHVNQTVAYFTDRPERSGGSLLLSLFIKKWNENLDSPPSMGVVFYQEGVTDYSEYPVDLTKPRYDEKSDTLTFHVKFLKPERTIKKRQIKEVTVFIDSRSP